MSATTKYVYVLESRVDYDAGKTVGVFSSLAGAQDFVLDNLAQGLLPLWKKVGSVWLVKCESFDFRTRSKAKARRLPYGDRYTITRMRVRP